MEIDILFCSSKFLRIFFQSIPSYIPYSLIGIASHFVEDLEAKERCSHIIPFQGYCLFNRGL